MKLFADARIRLIMRAILAGVLVGATMLQSADDPFSSAAWKAAVVAAGWAIVEAVTPLNSLVGWLKQPA
jgi:hypothetical protein